jgi:hypothetical protein
MLAVMLPNPALHRTIGSAPLGRSLAGERHAVRQTWTIRARLIMMFHEAWQQDA